MWKVKERDVEGKGKGCGREEEGIWKVKEKGCGREGEGDVIE